MPTFAAPQPVPEKLVVLSFDDAVKSHRTYVGPLLKQLGFGATFYVTHRWMDDTTNFMSWAEIRELHEMGFEIGNHSWTHADFSTPKNAARLAGELFLVDRALEREKVPRPTSFAYCGNTFGPEAVGRLKELGYKFARRGAQPEVPYGKQEIGATYDPQRHHPLVLPTTADAYPDWTIEHFKKVVARATNGQVVVLQFHGVPDVAHPWVHTPPEKFAQYMDYLKTNGFRCIAVRELEPYLDRDKLPADSMLTYRHPPRDAGRLALPVEAVATRRDLRFWLENMLVDHRYSWSEAAQVCALSLAEVQEQAAQFKLNPGQAPQQSADGKIRVLPYPGTRETRRGFFANVDAQRGTKASVFLPWDPASYIVMDLPEAIFSQQRLLFLAHTDVPTIWNEQNVIIENVDWVRDAGGVLRHERELPNKIAFGASVEPKADTVEMELWVRNGSDQPLPGLRTQICNLLKQAALLNDQTTNNKVFRCPVAAVRAGQGDRWVLVGWEGCGRSWGHPLVPCLHADPRLPDCAPGQTVRVRGRLWFYEGPDIESELAKPFASDASKEVK